MTVKRAIARAASLALVAGLGASAPVAQAHHINGERLCERKYDMSFKHWASDPIAGGAGRLSYNYKFDWIGRRIRLCVVTIRANHNRRRYTAVRIKAVDAGKWRRDASRDYRLFAGPVVRALWSHRIHPNPSRKRLRGRGTIGKAYTMFSVRYLHDSDDLPVLVRLRSRFCAADGYAHGRMTRWLDVDESSRTARIRERTARSAGVRGARCPSV
jgi:hypothetical protein